MMKKEESEKTQNSTIDNNQNYQNYWQHKWDRDYHHKSGIGPILLIILGIIFLLNNLDILPWEVWNNVWRYWPLLLILWGLQIMFGKSRVLNFLIAFVGLIFFLFILTIYTTTVNPQFLSWLNQQVPQLHSQNFNFLVK